MTEEHTFTFGDGQHLIGTLALPADRSPRDVALVLLNSGVIHRVGPHRINVKAARRFARAGIASIRFDLSGLGDAGPAPGGLPFERQAVSDLRAAMDELTIRTGARRFVLHGICSGAVHALATAIADDRVIGIALQDGFVFPTVRARIRRYTLRLRDGVPGAIAGALRQLRQLLPSATRPAPVVASSPDGPLGSGGYTSERFARTLDQLSARGTSTLVLYTGSILNLYNYPEQFAQRIRLRAVPSRVQCVFAPDIDHTLSNRHAQDRLLALLAGWVDALDDPAPRTGDANPPYGVDAHGAGAFQRDTAC